MKDEDSKRGRPKKEYTPEELEAKNKKLEELKQKKKNIQKCIMKK
jgi:hypothetical protein